MRVASSRIRYLDRDHLDNAEFREWAELRIYTYISWLSSNYLVCYNLRIYVNNLSVFIWEYVNNLSVFIFHLNNLISNLNNFFFDILIISYVITLSLFVKELRNSKRDRLLFSFFPFLNIYFLFSIFLQYFLCTLYMRFWINIFNRNIIVYSSTCTYWNVNRMRFFYKWMGHTIEMTIILWQSQ